jgi:hypothetical protein
MEATGRKKEAIIHCKDLLRRRFAALKKGARFAGDDDPYYLLSLHAVK